MSKSFRFSPNTIIGGKYIIIEKLGKGWEGEVYLVCEASTGVERTAKFFFPERNKGGKASKFYGKKLHKLRHCQILIQYHLQDTMDFKNEKITYLISEYIDGERLSDFIKRQPGQRLHYFMAMRLMHDICVGLEAVHAKGEYHGDLHADNVMINMRGIGFDMKILDMQNFGRPTSTLRKEDILNLTKILYDAVGGRKHYRNAPDPVKEICCGLKNTLILKKFPSVRKLRKYIEDVEWE